MSSELSQQIVTGYRCPDCGVATREEPVRCDCQLWIGPGYSAMEEWVLADPQQRIAVVRSTRPDYDTEFILDLDEAEHLTATGYLAEHDYEATMYVSAGPVEAQAHPGLFISPWGCALDL